uniref:Uncharacterized protein n=1 Tax=Anguilla anguilla TaxID=7936 RepID=A0A0E9ULT1_ANGAN
MFNQTYQVKFIFEIFEHMAGSIVIVILCFCHFVIPISSPMPLPLRLFLT